MASANAISTASILPSLSKQVLLSVLLFFFFLSPFVEMGFWLCLIFGFLWCRGGWRIGEWADCSRATSSIHSKQRTGLWWGLLLRKLHLTRNQGPRFRPESISSPMPLVSLSVPGVIAELLPLLVIFFNISSHFLIASLYHETIIDLYFPFRYNNI